MLIRVSVPAFDLSFCRPLKRANDLLGDVIPGAYARGYYLPPLRGWLHQTVETVFGPGVNQETGLDREF